MWLRKLNHMEPVWYRADLRWQKVGRLVRGRECRRVDVVSGADVCVLLRQGNV